MSTASLVGFAGAGLFAANEWTGPDRGIFSGVLWHGEDPDQAHKALVRVAGELVLLGVLVVLAGQGGAWTTFALAVIASLWVLWLINRNSAGNRAGAR